ncbi:2'-5' RNA ligase family protein [Ferroplasma sp.]|uniref:2'-5' RNA ligase family protein n=1 Tax=Ferroplasma sp. TaxID=2591003 RepID=UPI00307D0FAB
MKENLLSRIFIGSKTDIDQEFYDSLVFPGKKTNISLLHLTYYFFGDINESKITEIIEKMMYIKYSKINTKITGIGGFPSNDHARIIYLSLAIDVIPFFNNLMDILNVKNKNFVPHITLYRSKNYINIKTIQLNYSVVIESVCLYQSIFDGKRQYKPLYCAEFK